MPRKQQWYKKHPQFQYWSLALDFELTILICVQFVWQSNFQLHIDTLVKLMSLFCALNHINYAQLLPCIPYSRYTGQFDRGYFTVMKWLKSFYSISIKQIMSNIIDSWKVMEGQLVWQMVSGQKTLQEWGIVFAYWIEECLYSGLSCA